MQLVYDSQLFEGEYRELLKNAQSKDRIVQHTTVGIHKDDLILTLQKYPIKKAGSQGQQKTYLVSLKLAQFDFIKQISGIKPILLLDDILISLIGKGFGRYWNWLPKIILDKFL